MLTLGIDIGSTTSKCVLLRGGTEVAAKSLVISGTGTDGPDTAFQEVLTSAGVSREDVDYVLATGYGRRTFPLADGEISELTAHGKGVHFRVPSARTIIDIGGQDAKVIALTPDGAISNFVMNDKCAAGTGRFLDVMAGILKLDISELEQYAARASAPVKISSTCTVFAESEVISQLSQGAALPDLIAGICASVAVRVASLAKRMPVTPDVVMSGGVARNGGVRRAMEQELGKPVVVTDEAQYMGALGAARVAYERLVKRQG